MLRKKKINYISLPLPSVLALHTFRGRLPIVLRLGAPLSSYLEVALYKFHR